MNKTLKDVAKCHICGAYDYHEAKAVLPEEEFEEMYSQDMTSIEVVNCDVCGKPVCNAEEKESCGEVINYEVTYCNVCIKEMGKTDCDTCKQTQARCWAGREYGYVIGECPDFTDEEPEDFDEDE